MTEMTEMFLSNLMVKKLRQIHVANVPVIMLFLVMVILPGCAGGKAATVPAATTTPTAGIMGDTGNNSSAAASPQTCPVAVSSPSYWDAIVATQPGVTAVESLICANLTGDATLQALVLIRYSGTTRFLDIAVYDKITAPDPQLLFRLQGLYKGNAKLSAYNTILTSEVDPRSSLNKGKPDARLIPDLFREFKWSGGAKTFVPVAFPGLYPDLTRYQAELDQSNVDRGQDSWKRDAAQTASKMAVDLLKWPANSASSMTSGGGSNDLNAVVNVKNAQAGGGTLNVTLSRLGGKASGIWIVVAASSNGISITSPSNLNRLKSPVTVAGKGNASEGKIGRVIILDHLYTDIGHSDINGANGNGNTAFSTNVAYTSSFQRGTQEGIVVVFTQSGTGNGNAGAILIKVLLSA